jgi:hypothetical protein
VFLLNLTEEARSACGNTSTSGIPIQEKYRLSSRRLRPPPRALAALGREADDEHLQNIVNYVFAKYGKDRIKSFWLVGHSQGA